MEKMMTAAKKLDAAFRVVGVALMVGFVACFVGLAVIAVGLIFNLDPHMIGEGYASVDLGLAEFQLAEAFAPDYKKVLFVVAMQLLLMTPVFWIGKKCVLRIRAILAPMQEGAPFHAAVGDSLKKLALHAVELGVMLICITALSQAFTVYGYQLNVLLLSDKITKVTFNYSFDFSFLLIAAVLYLLSLVFSYGQELQQLSDETL